MNNTNNGISDESREQVSVTPNVKKRFFSRNNNGAKKGLQKNFKNNSKRVNADSLSGNPAEKKKGLFHKMGFSNSKNKLKVMFFGGVGEVGKNMTALMYGDDILVIDCGVAFPEEDMPGVDLVIPDMTWLKENANKIKGIVVTHAHEDHIGSMPYFLDTVKAPVYASKLTLSFIQNKLREFPKVKLNGKTVNPRDAVKIGCFQVEFVHVNHSIAGAFGLAITTPVGLVFHTGDFKIDFTPVSGQTTDLARMGELGNKGVLLLLSESTNAEFEGFSLSETVVKNSLTKIFEENKMQRLIITVFASNVYRVQQILELAKKYNRKVAFAGRSMINNLEVAMKIGEVKYDKDIIIDMSRIKNYKNEEIVILGTGSQGQPTTALARMARGEFPGVFIGPNDTVVFSSSPVPGNEKSVSNIINELMRCGANVIYNELASVHASGHACRNEFMIIHKLLKPKFFMPVHGELKHQLSHKKLAIEMGIKPDNIIIPENGMVVDVTSNSMKKAGEVAFGDVLVDGLGLGESDSMVLRDRIQMGEDGICVAVVGINTKTGTITKEPEILPRGLMYSHEADNLIEEAKQVLLNSIKNIDLKEQDMSFIKSSIRKTLTGFFLKKTKRKPIIIAVVV